MSIGQTPNYQRKLKCCQSKLSSTYAWCWSIQNSITNFYPVKPMIQWQKGQARCCTNKPFVIEYYHDFQVFKPDISNNFHHPQFWINICKTFIPSKPGSCLIYGLFSLKKWVGNKVMPMEKTGVHLLRCIKQISLIWILINARRHV